jgi:hypothetical protein
MKKINIVSVAQVVAVIDYSKLVTVREKLTLTSTNILDMVKNTVQLPYYDKAVVDFFKKTITLVSYSERILVEDDQD